MTPRIYPRPARLLHIRPYAGHCFDTKHQSVGNSFRLSTWQVGGQRRRAGAVAAAALAAATQRSKHRRSEAIDRRHRACAPRGTAAGKRRALDIRHRASRSALPNAETGTHATRRAGNNKTQHEQRRRVAPRAYAATMSPGEAGSAVAARSETHLLGKL